MGLKYMISTEEKIKRYNIIKEIVKSKEGKCISDEYVGEKDNMEFECKNGHRWKTQAGNIKRGYWCKRCVRIKNNNFETIQRIIKSKGGKCNSLIYLGLDYNLEFQCKNGHQWSTTGSSIISGSWCPYCNIYIKEKLCRLIFETIFKKPFPRCRPKWLIGKKGRSLELDGYNNDLKMAFEYNGEQHYKKTIFNDYTFLKKSFLELKERDQIKVDLCSKNNVILIIIPYIVSDTIKNLYKFIEKELIKVGRLEISIDINKINQKIKQSQDYLYTTPYLIEIQKIAEKNGGKCLSKVYINNSTKLKFQCKEGHIWKAIPNSIKNGSWCPYCVGYSILNPLEELQDIAISKNGKCISNKYLGSSVKHKFQCYKGHIWEALPTLIKQGYWCMMCSYEVKMKNMIKILNKIVKSKGGKCLSTDYNEDKKMLFQCNYGHQWESLPNSIIYAKSWCPYCSGHTLINPLEELQQIAITKGGKCLSIEYINSQTKMKFECNESHQWEATPNHIKSGQWCPICAKKKRGESIRQYYVMKNNNES